MKNLIKTLLVTVIFLSGCSSTDEKLNIIEQKTENLGRPDYTIKLKEKDVFKLLDSKTIQITYVTDCGVKFFITSIKENNNDLKIETIEKGKNVCDAGPTLQKITANVNRPISEKNIEVFNYSEYQNSTNKIYSSH